MLIDFGIDAAASQYRYQVFKKQFYPTMA